MLKRLDLPDGQWADLLVKPTHADYVAILEAAEAASTGAGTWVQWALVIGRRYCKAWLVRGPDGSPLDVNDWGPADPDITDAICTEAQNRYGEWSESRSPLVTRRQRTPRLPETPSPRSDDTSEDAPSE
jgi:hypothetical protein